LLDFQNFLFCFLGNSILNVIFFQFVEHHFNLSKAMSQLFNMEQTISLIKNFKHFSDKNSNSTEFSDRVKTKCCTGYMINLLQRMAQDLDFEFDFYFLSNKKHHVPPMIEQESAQESPVVNHDEMSDAINHVIKGLAHMAVGPYSLTVDRLKRIDFSMPFLYSGYALLIKQEKKGVDDLFMFMKPFTYLHWALIVFFALGSAISLAMLEFNSPFGLNPKGRQRARNYTLGSAISMVISLMFMHTMPAKSPKSWAGKWTQNFIASFALIFIATYTAQMASILSAGQESKVFKGIDDHDVRII
jgi:ionotropic glutamate receptor NMDA 3A